MTEWLRGVRRWLRRRSVEKDIADEMRAHVEMEAADRLRSGDSPKEARRRALVAFGGVDRYHEAGRDALGLRMWTDLESDVRYGLRALARTPAYAWVAALTLALGIGGNTAMFSVVDAVALRALAYPEPSALVSVWDNAWHPDANYEAIRDRARSYEALGAYQANVGFNLSGDGEALRVQGARFSAGVFEALGVEPALGRVFTAENEEIGQAGVIVLSDALFRGRFGGDASMIGRPVEVDGTIRTVIGVMPPGFRFPDASARMWAPITPNQANQGAYWGNYYMRLIARLRTGADAGSAAAEVRSIARELRQENPVWTPVETYGQDATVVPLRESIVGDSRPMLLVLLGAVGLVLLVASANVANLALARGAARGRELAVRAAIGAGRGRLFRQLLTESVLLGVLGGALGIVLAIVAVRMLSANLPAGIPRADEIVVNARVLLFTAGITLITALLFGVAPALRGSRASHAEALREGGRGAGGTRANRRFASILVASEIALAVVLITGAALLLQSFWRLRAVDPGFRTSDIFTVQVHPPQARYAEPNAHQNFYRELLERVDALPGVREAALANHVPFDGFAEQIAMWLDGYTTDPNNLTVVNARSITPDYVDVVGISLVQGRGFTDADRLGSAPVALIDEAMAAAYWAGRDPIGGRIRYPWGGDWITVVGVVGNARDESLEGDFSPTFYVPFAQRSAQAVLVIASSSPPGTLLREVRSAVSAIDASVPVSDAQMLSERVSGAVSSPRFTAALLIAFATMALLLGAIGIYGLVAYSVSLRLREFGVRMALGATRRSVTIDVIRSSLLLTIAGIVPGLLLALGLTRLIQGLLFGIAASDPLTFAIVPVILGAVALMACTIPARRAARVAPMTVMRES